MGVDGTGGSSGLERVLAMELLPGEQVLWSGRPDASRLFNRADLVAVPASIFYALIAGFFVAGAVHNLTDPPVVDGVPKEIDVADVAFWALMGGFFVVTAAYALIGRLVWKRLDRKRTRYVMTDRRLLDVQVNGRRRVASMPLVRVVGTRSEVRRDGGGTVAFGDSSRGTPSRSALHDIGGIDFGAQANAGPAIVFRDVDDADDLLALLRERGVGV